MTGDRLKEIEERAAAATPGPWESDEDCPLVYFGGGIYGLVADCHCITDDPEERAQAEVDAAFIAAARTDVPDLVAEVQKLHSVLTELLDLWNIAAIVPKWISGSPHPALGSRVGPAWAAAREALGREV